MAASNVKIINSSTNDPQVRGKTERTVPLNKTTMKRFWQQHLQALFTENTYQ
jgi:hypothetical protein